ncbi:5'-deoxynucleotidase [Clostridiaceae bacterium OttesenSCG-928-D20]|nr:5'-deoxynucleotidase [Clostridiaceae bacterium OttesenSCG-928-D20]
MNSYFFALISRMRYISRWGLMRNSLPESLQEHSHMTAVLAHALALIGREIFEKDCDPNELAAIALYHDAPEIYTGDMPTPIKYYNDELRSAYKKVEEVAAEKLIDLLPGELRPAFSELICYETSEEKKRIIRAADKLSAYIKCIEERKTGNAEFISAEAQLRDVLEKMEMEEVDYFMKHFIPAFELTIDDIGGLNK